MRKILILGGAGFIGSNIASYFYSKGTDVTVIDGLMDRTGGSQKNLVDLDKKIKIIYKQIEKTQNLKELIIRSDLIINCMAWTSHHAALNDPLYDYELNCKSHLHLINYLKNTKNKKIILLSSRGVYGNAENNIINDNTPPNPVDIQGIHKLTTENYFKIYSKLYDFNVLTLRIPNCFGKNQIITGDDIGLVGTFIRDALLDKLIEVYGSQRKRSLIYINDVVNIVWLVGKKNWNGYVPINIPGTTIPILELANKIIKIAGSGKISLKKLPTIIGNIDIGNAIIDESKITEFVGNMQIKNIEDALIDTINYFKRNLI